MRADEYLIGFDARERWLTKDEDWGTPWKSAALLNANVDKPLSIDAVVWPSVFDLVGPAKPTYTGLFSGLWASLASLTAALDRLVAPYGPFCVAAFSVTALDAERDSSQRWRDLAVAGEVAPASRDPAWAFAGYDVADESGTSALMTMRVPTDADLLRTRFGPRLNRAHLFDELSAAIDFRTYSDSAIPEHAPFAVYGLWCVRNVEGSL